MITMYYVERRYDLNSPYHALREYLSFYASTFVC